MTVGTEQHDTSNNAQRWPSWPAHQSTGSSTTPPNVTGPACPLDIAKRVVDNLGMGHEAVNNERYRLSGVSSVVGATNQQLRLRVKHGEAWLAKRVRS